MTQQDMNQEVDKNLFRFAGRELAGSSDRTPLTEFIGTLTSWDVKKSNYGDGTHQIVLSFDNIEALQVRDGSPYPFSTAEIAVKHSGSERSGFGMLIATMDKAVQAKKNQSDMDNYVGKVWHFHIDRFNWGKIPNSTVADENGDRWCDIWQAELSTSNTATRVFVEVPVAPVVATPVTAVPTSAEEIALSLLDGRTQADWTPVMVTDSTIQQSPLFTSLMDNSWLAGKIASGEVTKDDQDVFHVTK